MYGVSMFNSYEREKLMTKFKNRETFLETAVDQELRPMFKEAGYPLPKKIKVTCGWPSKSAGRSSKQRIGECWDKSASKVGNVEIIISMALDNTAQVLDVLIHECVHAAVGNACGHKGPFRTLAMTLGLEGKMTATTAGVELSKKINAMKKRLGKYPHSAIDFSNRKKQSTRMIKVTCVDDDCGMVFRTSKKWVEYSGGGMDCPICHTCTVIDY